MHLIKQFFLKLLVIGLVANSLMPQLYALASNESLPNPCPPIWLKPKNSLSGNLRLPPKDLDCSIPEFAMGELKLRQEAKAFFLPACATHDLCYNYGSYSYQHSRQTCDANFLVDLIALCQSQSLPPYVDLASCLVDAQNIFTAVRLLGFPYYLSPHDQHELNDYPFGLAPHNNDRGEECEYQKPRPLSDADEASQQ